MKTIPKHIIFLIVIYIAGLLLFGFFRTILLLFNLALLDQGGSELIMQAYINGLTFDSIASFYVIALPTLILTILHISNIQLSRALRGINIYFITVFAIYFSICISDIQYFGFYNSRITKEILSWSSDIASTITILFTDIRYLLSTVIIVVLVFILSRGFKYLRINIVGNNQNNNHLATGIMLGIFALYMIAVGVRGRFNLNDIPVDTEEAFFSDYAFINQLSINPVFNFINSYTSYSIDHFSDEAALEKAREYLNIQTNLSSPIARMVESDTVYAKPNVIIILVESLSAAKVGFCGAENSCTPFLDSLANESIAFKNIYTSGIHTRNGIYSSLYGHPAIMDNRPMEMSATTNQSFTGLPNILEQQGYKNVFLCTNSRRFDNMGGFLNKNGFQKVVSNEDYPDEAMENKWGVSDLFMYNYSFDIINEYSKTAPFLCTFLTISSHEGEDLPSDANFKPASKITEDQIYEYVDWAIQQFMKKASRQPWFKNTIFAIIADHGQNFDPVYDLTLSYHHSPMIIYAPFISESKMYEKIGMQIDFFPTIMNYIPISYTNNSLGINLINNSRPFAYFTADDKLGCINDEYFLTIRKSGKESLYKYKLKDIQSYSKDNAPLIKEMKDYSYSMLQTSQWMIYNKALYCCE